MNSIDEPAGQLSLHGRPFGVEIQQLLAFLAIYEERQVTLAARRLGRSQSALSHALSYADIDRMPTLTEITG